MSIEERIELLLDKYSIPDEDKELYIYGIRQGIFMLINIITTFVLGFLLRMFLCSVLYFVVYSTLRIYAGGAHAKTPLRCYIYSTMLTASVLLLVKYLPHSFWLVFGILMVSSFIVYLVSPVESRNKPLSSKEVELYKRRVNLLLFFYVAIGVVLLVFQHILFAFTIAVSIGALSFMLLWGRKTEINRLK